MTFFDWVQRRELGLQTIGDEDFIHKFVYNSFKPYQTWSSGTDRRPDYGAVFNLEFSPEGNLLVAACEKKAILLFDPITTKRIKTICNAHTDSVNCIKFLDNRQFASCSDDTTVALWDTRNLKQKIRSLHGHSNWVKNIEYSQKDGLLVTSGFDGSIYTWDTNALTEQGFVYQKVFHTSGLMRCRITPDASKLVISTTGGYLIIIHDLDLTTLAKDLCGFRPNIYRLMQLGRQFIPQAAKFDHVFSKSQKTNRVELVSDFPEHNDAEVLCALQIHPHGLCALSRNISYDEGSEWTCIHDIQEKDEEHEYKKKRKHSEIEDPPSNESRDNISSSSSTNFEPSRNVASTSSNSASGATDSNRNESFVPDIWAAEITVKDRACRIIRGPRTSNTGNSAYAYVYAISSGVLATPTNRNSTADWNWTPPREEARDKAIYMSIYDRQINQNVRRLMYYIEEPNRGKGFIKEPSFSSDGRLICSPYGFGVRLLSFNDELNDFSKAISLSGELPQVLKEFKQINCHSDIVVSTKFSHRYPLLVTGCLKGKITWHQTEFSN